MKLLFFCASLEPGRDGVGDYTRRLAGECAARDHECMVIALHDPHLPDRTDLTLNHVRSIRLPASEPWPDRLLCALQYLQRFEPDWASWQLVAQGFHPRGFLPSDLLEGASDLRGPRCHVMLHELWLGLEVGASWRSRGLGWLQRRGLLCLLDQLDPECVQTSQFTYQQVLIREGFSAGVIGLFGNVPIAESFPDPNNVLAQWLPASSHSPAPVPLVAITFGTLHRQWQPAATIAWLQLTARRLNRTPVLIAIGRMGGHAPKILEAFKENGIAMTATGELDAEAISALLRCADFGIAPHPWALIGKSGAAAAMLEHGLPVLVPRDDWRLRGAPLRSPIWSDPLLTRLAGLSQIETDRWLAARRPPASALPQIADTLLEALKQRTPRAFAPSA